MGQEVAKCNAYDSQYNTTVQRVYWCSEHLIPYKMDVNLCSNINQSIIILSQYRGFRYSEFADMEQPHSRLL